MPRYFYPLSVDHIVNYKLLLFVQDLTETAVREGDLEGLILTGLSARSVDLFQRYIDRTGDLQTAALMLSFVSFRLQDKRINDWIER
jgi:hypothetical protein